MTEYRIFWTIELDADSPHHAAHLAHQIMLDPESLATYFVVVDPDGNSTSVDLLGDQP